MHYEKVRKLEGYESLMFVYVMVKAKVYVCVEQVCSELVTNAR
jgi:hypothetical protein